MHILVMIRHGESEWNKANLFTGWTDVELSENGWNEAHQGGKLLRGEGFSFDICYTSYLKRDIAVLGELDEEWIPVVKDWRLNERHYGALQGLNKSETAAEYGAEQVRIWRRSFDIQPPALEPADERNPALQKMYRNVEKSLLPLTESLKDTIARVVPYYENVIKKDIEAGRNVLIATHGNSLRALVKYIDGISDDDIVGINIPTGVPLVYELDDDLKAISHRYLGDAEELEAKIQSVAKQGEAK